MIDNLLGQLGYEVLFYRNIKKDFHIIYDSKNKKS